jgi:hypothetical protein
MKYIIEILFFIGIVWATINLFTSGTIAITGGTP